VSGIVNIRQRELKMHRLGARSGKVVLFSHSQFGDALAVRCIGLAVIEAQHSNSAAAGYASRFVSILGGGRR
jgi:hypothetical protein